MATPMLLEARGITKRFGGIEALRGANFAIGKGEVVALMGDNGAGKSTLVKTLCGVYQPDEGQILFDGEPVTLTSPRHAQALGPARSGPAVRRNLDERRRRPRARRASHARARPFAG